MCRFRNRDMDPPVRTYSWGFDYLDLEVQSDQWSILQPDQTDLSVGQLMRDCSATAGSRRMPQRKLNVLGEINAYSVVANDESRVKRMESILELAATVDEMKSGDATGKAEAIAAKGAELKEKHLSSGLTALAKEGALSHAAVMKLKVKQMEAILLDRLGTRVIAGTKKSAVADLFIKKATDINWQVPALAAEPPSTPAEPTPAIGTETPTPTTTAHITGVADATQNDPYSQATDTEEESWAPAGQGQTPAVTPQSATSPEAAALASDAP